VNGNIIASMLPIQPDLAHVNQCQVTFFDQISLTDNNNFQGFNGCLVLWGPEYSYSLLRDSF
jgi:hypothetical protein